MPRVALNRVYGLPLSLCVRVRLAVRLRDLSAGGGGSERDGETLVDTAGMVSWAGESTLFYVKFDHAHRPFQVWRHSVAPPSAPPPPSPCALFLAPTRELSALLAGVAPFRGHGAGRRRARLRG